METKDPALTKTRITDANTSDTNNSHSHVDLEDNNENKNTQTLQETVIGSRYVSDDDDHSHGDIDHNHNNVMSTNNDIEEYTTINKSTDTFQETVVGSEHVDDGDIEDQTTVNKGTDTFQEGIVDSEHVNEGDNPARQPDPRDQEGSTPFDESINEDTVGSEEPKSDDITDMNRYSTLDNAQSRVLTPDEED
ncbi:hypothetical protein [Psychrobacter frigidicola]|uniref:hypothetical protein n=1 Tax=Psychrobacter frigidicola TaxID=45611 RepID=UPI00191A2A4D|nr:hypothetical protein [Psychrobacter frigidicola]